MVDALDTGGDRFALRDYLRVLRRRWLLVVVTVFLAVGGSLAYGDDVILGGPLFRRNGAGWGTGSVAGGVYLAQALRGGAAGDPWWRPSSFATSWCGRSLRRPRSLGSRPGAHDGEPTRRRLSRVRSARVG